MRLKTPDARDWCFFALLPRPASALSSGLHAWSSQSIPRSQAADAADAAGCRVDDGITKHTTMLVVGGQDLRTLLAGHRKSSKHRKAEQLIAGGQPIRILGESDFMRLVSPVDAPERM